MRQIRVYMMTILLAGLTGGWSASADVLDELGDADYHRRDEATRRLLADSTLTLAEVGRMYARARTPEQRHRLLSVAEHHAIRQMRERIFPPMGQGSIGLSHAMAPANTLPGIDATAIRVVMTIPGFPGHELLRPGDLITAFDDEPFPIGMTQTDFKALIKNRRKGGRIALSLLRDGRPVRVEMSLAGSNALEAMYPINGDTLMLDRPFRDEWRRLRDAIIQGDLPQLDPREGEGNAGN